jgi:arylsulfatase A
LNMIENTMVIFYSDNGGVFGNPPLRENKGSMYEGGIRVPLIISCPAKIAAGKTCDEPVTTVDFFPTMLELANVSPSNYKQLEGLSLLPLFKGNKSFPERAIYWHFPHHRDTELSMASAIREGDWKLVKEFESGKLYLFNLKEDIGEEKNLISEYPEETKSLLDKLEKWQNKVGAEMPQVNPEYNETK